MNEKPLTSKVGSVSFLLFSVTFFFSQTILLETTLTFVSLCVWKQLWVYPIFLLFKCSLSLPLSLSICSEGYVKAFYPFPRPTVLILFPLIFPPNTVYACVFVCVRFAFPSSFRSVSEGFRRSFCLIASSRGIRFLQWFVCVLSLRLPFSLAHSPDREREREKARFVVPCSLHVFHFFFLLPTTHRLNLSSSFSFPFCFSPTLCYARACRTA